MKAWHFTEQSCYPVWDKIPGELRVTQPNSYCEPELAGKLLNMYLDQYCLADEMGLNIMLNEHHVASTCMIPSVQLQIGILARQTKKARLLALGAPITNRPDPARVAEEYAMIDAISGGRLEMGMVKGAGWELFASNQNPVRIMDRFWEAHDLIVKAMTTHDGPFSWEGEYYQYRNINIWPRPIQLPHPPIWMTSHSPNSARGVAEKGYVTASFLQGLPVADTFAAYRERYRQVHGHEPAADRLGYAAMIAVSKDKSQATRKAQIMRSYLASLKRTAEPFRVPPGYGSLNDFAKNLMGPAKGRVSEATPRRLPDGRSAQDNPTDEELAQIGLLFSGTPDEVFNQIKAFHRRVGGFGHLIVMCQAGKLENDDTCENIKVFAEEVYPRLGELNKLYEMA